MLDAVIAAARLLEAGGAVALFGGPLLMLAASTPAEAAPWAAPSILAAAVACGAGSLLALGAQTVGMAGSWREGLSVGALAGVVAETGFGRSVAVRVLAAAAAALLARSAGTARGRIGLAALGGGALASLAWSGHGAAGEGAGGAAHLVGDVVHLLAAGAWLGALAALVALGAGARGRPDRRRALTSALDAVSGAGAAVVALLLLSGLANAWALVGPEHWRQLPASGWGRLLLAKLALFAAMVILAALNRWRLAPRLAAEGSAAALRPLALSVGAEAALGLAVLAAAAAMGGLAPPAAQG